MLETAKKFGLYALTLAGAACLWAAAPASAASVNFGYANPPSDGGSEDAIDPFAGFFSTTISDLGDGAVLFQFENGSPVGMIGSVYFEDTAGMLDSPEFDLGSSVSIDGIDFKEESNPKLPQGSKSDFSESYGFTSHKGMSNGVAGGEVLGLKFIGEFEAVKQAMTFGLLRVGMHIQSISYTDRSTGRRFNGDSDILISNPDVQFSNTTEDPPSAVPLPAPFALLIGGIAALGGLRLARRKAAA